MNKDAALATLGLSGEEDARTIARVYGERLSVLQGQLVAAQTDADRIQCQTKLSQLVESYEFVTSTGRYTKAANDSAPNGAAGDTLPKAADSASPSLSSETELASPPSADTFVRIETGAVLAGRLEVGPMLGAGGMGYVYAARDRLKNEDVAIKVLRQDLLYSTAAKDRFMAEAKVSCSLSHPNIVRVHDVGMTGGYYYLSMERLYGQTLRQRMEAYWREHRNFTLQEVADIARQLIDALRYAHRYIVHRDIKPENIWLAEDGTVKLMDFGIARAFTASQLTQTGVTLGTAYYMAPEQRIAAREVDWRADQYALGVVLYELLAGTLPTGATQSVDELRRDVPRRRARALMRAMAPKPEQRFASLSELLAEIDTPRRKAAGLAAVLLIGAGVAAAAGVTFVVMKREPAPTPAEVKAAAPAAAAQTKPETTEAGPPGPPPPAQTAAAGPAGPESQDSKRQAQVVETPPAAAVPGPSAADTKPEQTEPAQPEPRQVVAPPPKKSASAPTRVAVADHSAADSARQACVAQCERDSGECRSINRRAKQDCMRAVAFNGTGRATTTSASASCAFYDEERCTSAYDRDACRARIADRYRVCVGVLGDSIASRRQDCEDNSHQADRMCMDELRDCRVSCQ